MKQFVFIALLIFAVQAVSNKPHIQFKNGEFTLIQVYYPIYITKQFTDLHYGESLENDVNTTRLMENIVEQEKPDFLSFTGDMVAGIP